MSPATTAARPRRSWWTHAWQLALCHLVGLILWLVTWGDVMERSTPRQDAVILLDALTGLLLTQLVLWRHRRPLSVTVALLVSSIFCAWTFPALWAAIVHLASRRRGWEITLAGVLMLASSAANDLFIGTIQGRSESLLLGEANGVPWLVAMVVPLYLVLVAYGWNRGAKAELVESWRSAAELARREQVARVAQAQTAERARIAREMHDLLAHKISLISLHAGVLAYKDDLSRDETAEAAAVIRDTAHQALEELREVLGVLRDDGHVAVAPPQPSLLDLPALVAAEEAAGSQVVLQVPEAFWQQAAGLGPATARHAHRIVQEALTNARKHALGEPVTVSIDGDPERGLLLAVSNPVGHQRSRVPGAGLGLAGLQERATLAGGSLDVQRTDQLFRVTAQLPWNVRMGS